MLLIVADPELRVIGLLMIPLPPPRRPARATHRGTFSLFYLSSMIPGRLVASGAAVCSIRVVPAVTSRHCLFVCELVADWLFLTWSGGLGVSGRYKHPQRDLSCCWSELSAGLQLLKTAELARLRDPSWNEVLPQPRDGKWPPVVVHTLITDLPVLQKLSR